MASGRDEERDRSEKAMPIIEWTKMPGSFWVATGRGMWIKEEDGFFKLFSSPNKQMNSLLLGVYGSFYEASDWAMLHEALRIPHWAEEIV